MNTRLQAAIRLRESGDLDEARALLLALAADAPGDPEVLYQCAWTHDASGLERDAVGWYERALAAGLAGDSRAGAYLGLGSTLRGLGEYPRALATLERGGAEFPDDRALRVFRAMALYNSGRARDAVAELLVQLADTSADPGIMRFQRAIHFYAEDLDRIWTV